MKPQAHGRCASSRTRSLYFLRKSNDRLQCRLIEVVNWPWRTGGIKLRRSAIRAPQTSPWHAFFSTRFAPRPGSEQLSCRGLGRSSRLGQGRFSFASTNRSSRLFSDATAFAVPVIISGGQAFSSAILRAAGEEAWALHRTGRSAAGSGLVAPLLSDFSPRLWLPAWAAAVSRHPFRPAPALAAEGNGFALRLDDIARSTNLPSGELPRTTLVGSRYRRSEFPNRV